MIPDNRDFLRREVSSPYPFEPDMANDGVNLAVTNSSARAALPGFGLLMAAVITNYGTVAAFVRFGNSSVVATTGSHCILPGTQVALSLPASATPNATYIAAITESGTTSIQVSTGWGV